MNEKPLYVTYSKDDWYAWAEDIPMTKLAAKDMTQAMAEGRAIAQGVGRGWGGRRRTPGQESRRKKNRARRGRQRKASRLSAMEMKSAEYRHYTWANRANWTNEDWNDYQGGVLPNDFEDDRDEDEDDCFGVAVGDR